MWSRGTFPQCPRPSSIPFPKARSHDLQLGRRGIRVELAVLADGEDGSQRAVLFDAAHDAARDAHLGAGLDDLAVYVDDGADGDGPQVGAVEGAADAQVLPEARLGDDVQGPACAEVEEGGRAAAVQVAAAVGVHGLRVQAEGDGRERRRRVRVNRQVRLDERLPVLGQRVSRSVVAGWLACLAASGTAAGRARESENAPPKKGVVPSIDLATWHRNSFSLTFGSLG